MYLLYVIPYRTTVKDWATVYQIVHQTESLVHSINYQMCVKTYTTFGVKIILIRVK